MENTFEKILKDGERKGYFRILNDGVKADLPLFIDPFLLFNGKKKKYQQLHDHIIKYLVFFKKSTLDKEQLKLTANYWKNLKINFMKIIFNTTIMLGIFLLFGGQVLAQGMMGSTITSSDGHTAREEAEGKAVWEKLQAKELTCKDLSDDNFGTLGEYFMGQMTGASHEAMNNMMIQMMGEQGEEQMHVVMSKRLSGCDTSATIPPQGVGFMPMMQMMIGGWSSPFGSNQSNNPMMNFGLTPFGGFGWIFMILWWVLIITGIVALIKWLTGQSRGTHGHEKSPLEILKERYAKGEIDKKEFEERKKDLG